MSCWSLPAREAWIEIDIDYRWDGGLNVASRKGSVDWNLSYLMLLVRLLCRFPQGKRGLKLGTLINSYANAWSLPAREAWIEIIGYVISLSRSAVASRKGSVDWNYWWKSCFCVSVRRFPQGKRGLKLWSPCWYEWSCLSLPAREAWIEILFNTAISPRCAVASRKGSVDWNLCG